jgi:uncharacterized protein
MKFENLPKKIPIFPLSSAIFFPGTILPLNIFEERYLQMINDSIKNDRVFGMIQPMRKSNLSNNQIVETETYKVGCLGKIINFNETQDNRFVISLLGLCRFNIVQEIKSEKLYRNFSVDYKNFKGDLDSSELLKTELKLNEFMMKVKLFFKQKNFALDWGILKNLNQRQLIDTICMIAPLSIEEKQKLLETKEIKEKLYTLSEILDFNLQSQSEIKTIQ